MPGRVPGTHVFAPGTAVMTWMAGTSPAMAGVGGGIERSRECSNYAAFSVVAVSSNRSPVSGVLGKVDTGFAPECARYLRAGAFLRAAGIHPA
jgi:hypothetical protein